MSSRDIRPDDGDALRRAARISADRGPLTAIVALLVGWIRALEQLTAALEAIVDQLQATNATLGVVLGERWWDQALEYKREPEDGCDG